MPATAPTNGSLLLDSHEDRLQKVETSVQEIALKVNEIGIKQDFGHQQQEDFRQELRQLLSVHAQKMQAVEDLNQRQEQRLAPLEAHHEARVTGSKARRDLIKKLAIGALLAGAGVIGTKGVEILFGLVTR